MPAHTAKKELPPPPAGFAVLWTRILHRMQVEWLVPRFLRRQGTKMRRDTLTNPAQILKRTRSIFRIS
jgi:hypothetical protein